MFRQSTKLKVMHPVLHARQPLGNMVKPLFTALMDKYEIATATATIHFRLADKQKTATVTRGGFLYLLQVFSKHHQIQKIIPGGGFNN